MKVLKNDGTVEVRFTARFNEKLYSQLKSSAQKNKRSIAKELEFITELYLNK